MSNHGLLILSHSSRSTDLRQCSLNFLTRRYSKPNRLLQLPPFDTLAPAPSSYSGALSFIKLVGEGYASCYLGSIKSKEKIQHAVQISPHEIVVGFESRIELWKACSPLKSLESVEKDTFKIARTYEHPHFSGLHTVFVIESDRVVVSCSGPDSVFILNLRSGTVEVSFRLPSSLYGRNYELDSSMNLHNHFIMNDYQLSHINCAFPINRGQTILVSTLIQGAIGFFDVSDGSYRELTRGFVGCHGVRMNQEGDIYFADSVTGCLVFLNKDGTIKKRFSTGSRWLHDVQQIHGDVYAFSLSDKNSLYLFDIKQENLLLKRKFITLPVFVNSKYYERLPFWLGNSVQFISYF